MKAIILAAGYATRLHPLTFNKPKCLLLVDNKPILNSICQKLNAVPEIDEIIIVTNAKFYSQLTLWSLTFDSRASIKIIDDGTASNETRLGAIGDLSLAIREASVDADVLMMASDNLFDQSLKDFVDFAKSRKEAVSIAVYDIGDPKLASKKFGVIESDGKNRVTSMEEKPEFPKSSFIGMGVYFFPKSSLKLISQYLSHDGAQDAPGYYISWLFDQGNPVYSFQFKGMWYDIGDLKALEEANNLFKTKHKF